MYLLHFKHRESSLRKSGRTLCDILYAFQKEKDFSKAPNRCLLYILLAKPGLNSDSFCKVWNFWDQRDSSEYLNKISVLIASKKENNHSGAGHKEWPSHFYCVCVY